MHDGFGFVNPVTGPILERITREEHLNRDNPRRPREGKPRPAGQGGTPEAESPTEQAPGESNSTHIDLRV